MPRRQRHRPTNHAGSSSPRATRPRRPELLPNLLLLKGNGIAHEESGPEETLDITAGCCRSPKCGGLPVLPQSRQVFMVTGPDSSRSSGGDPRAPSLPATIPTGRDFHCHAAPQRNARDPVRTARCSMTGVVPGDRRGRDLAWFRDMLDGASSPLSIEVSIVHATPRAACRRLPWHGESHLPRCFHWTARSWERSQTAVPSWRPPQDSSLK